jgi:hypothetical protein
MSSSHRLLTLLAVLTLTGLQASALQSDATITFKLVWKEAQPSMYSVVIRKNGQAEYVSEDRGLSPPQERNAPVESNAEQHVQSQDAASQDAFHKQFQASDGLRQKLFALAEQANFFDREVDFTKHLVAQTGRKTLSYSDSAHHGSATYNYSEDRNIQELTDIFQGISTTIEGGRKLEFDRRFDKLSLDQELKSLEELSNEGHLQEVQAIAPLLQSIAADRTVLHIAQMRAQRILKKAGQPVAPTPVE